MGYNRLTADSDQAVTELMAIMKCYPNMTIQLVGHTDNTGDLESNKKLSVDRAEAAIKNMVVAGGIGGSRISAACWRQEKPIASNDTEEEKATNRRTELIVTKIT